MDRSQIIAVDFDGTLCFSAWPDVVEPNDTLIPYLKGTLKKWYEDNKERLIEDYHSGNYSVLPEWE